jgi:hypothetical protein
MAPLRPAQPSSSRSKEADGFAMLDIAYIALALAGFALFAIAVRGCERL